MLICKHKNIAESIVFVVGESDRGSGGLETELHECQQRPEQCEVGTGRVTHQQRTSAP